MGKVATSPLRSRGSPPLQSGRAKSEVAHLWAKWLHHPCRLGNPHRFRAEGEIRSGHLVGKVATSPLPSRASPPLQSGGGNQKWPTIWQSGYVTPAVSGIPIAAELGIKTEMAHKWAKWLRHPCRLGDPHRFRAGGKIRSGPQVGKVATPPLPSRGSPPLHSGGQNQKWPTSGQSGYVIPAVSGIPTAAERGRKSEVAHKWAKWLHHPCRLEDPHRFGAGGEIRSGPQVGKVATSPLPPRRSPPLQSGGQNQKWPTSGQSGYVTPTVSGIPTASEGGAKSEVAHLWAKWPRHPCRLWDPHRFRAGGKIRSGPQVGKVATSPLPSRGFPAPQSGEENQRWPTSGQSGYVTPAVSGIPTASERGAKWEVAHKWQSGYVTPAVSQIPTAAERGRKSEVAHKWAKWLRHPYRLGDPPLQRGGQNQKLPTCGQSGHVTLAVSGIPTASERGAKSEVAHKWAKWLRHPCRLGDSQRPRAGKKIRGGPQVGKVATSPLPSRGSPPLQSGGQNQKWPSSGQSGYVTPAVSGIPTASERRAKSEVAHLWAKWLHHPCRLGNPHRFRAEGEIRSGHLVGKVATSLLPPRASPPLQSGGGNQKWPTIWQSGYVTPAVSGIPIAAELGRKTEMAHKWAKWLRHPCRLGYPHRFRAGGQIRSGPQVGKVATPPLPSRGSPPLHSGGQNQKWPTSGQSGYVIPAVSGIPTAAEWGRKSEVAHKWAKWLHHPCRLEDPHRFGAGGEIRSGPQVGKVATSPLPPRGSPPLQRGGQNQKWPTSGQSGYVTPAVSQIPTAAERARKSEVAHKWAKWLRHPYRLGDPHRFRGGGKIRSGPLVGKVATSPLPSRGSPPLQSGGQNQKWPTFGQSGYVTPAVSGIPSAPERGRKSEVAHKWAKWLRHPCRLGDPHRFRAEGKIRSGPLVGKVATSPLPSRQSGYVIPPVSQIPTAAERGRKSEVAHKWAKWLRHPYRLGDPHRFRGGGKIRSGPLVGKVATSPLPSRGSPPLQSVGQNQKWPTFGQSGYVTPAVSGIPSAPERGRKSEVAHKWAKWLHHPSRLGDPHRFRAGGKIRSGPQVGKVATSPLPSRGSPPLRSGGRNQKWPTSGQSGYVTPAASGIPTASERGAKSEVAHKWAKWLRHPCRLGDPHRFRAGDKIRSGQQVAKWLRHPRRLRDPHRFKAEGEIRSGPQVSKVATSRPPSQGSPHRFRAGGKITSGPQVGKVATSPLRSRGSPPLQSGGKIRSGPLVGKVATSPLPSRESPPLQSGGGNQKWPPGGESGYVTRAVSGITTASERGG